MAKMGVNVPEGRPAFTVEEVAKAAEELADSKGEVCALEHTLAFAVKRAYMLKRCGA